MLVSLPTFRERESLRFLRLTVYLLFKTRSAVNPGLLTNYKFMAKINFLQTQTQKNGIPIGSAWKNSKGGFGITLKGKFRDPKTNQLVDVNETVLNVKVGKDLMELKLGNYDKAGNWQPSPAKLLGVPRTNKRQDRKDPDYVIYCFPEKQ